MNIPDLVNMLAPAKQAGTISQSTASGEDDTTTNNTTETSDTSDSSSSSTSTTSDPSEEFDTFLQLLTAQIRNQDPLAPLDSTQFVEQLATFSQLELQASTNQKLDEITRLLAAQGYQNSSSTT